MIEQEYLKYCLDEVEEKLRWQPSSEWTESDFKRLASIISEKSNISISPHTLKRLYGKIKYKAYYNPQLATKNALVKFLGYNNWQGFVETRKSSNSANPLVTDSVGSGSRISKKYYFSFILVVAVIMLLVFQSHKNDTKEAERNFEFSVTDSVGKVPFTITANYNLSKFGSDSTRIDFGTDHPIRGRQIILADTSRYIHNFTYQIPGYYKVKLIGQDEVLATKKVLAKSDGWNSYVVYEVNRKNYWLDNEIKKIDTSSYLYFSPKFLKRKGFNTKSVYYLVHRLYKDFEVNGDSFELIARFKNSEKIGGITCYDFILDLICENNANHLKLMEEGCSQFSGIKIGNKTAVGTYEDLSAFAFDLNDWNTVKLHVKNQEVKVSINDKLIYEFEYSGTNGKLLGIENSFKGSGVIDFIRIKDLDTNKEFIENFDQ